MHLSLPSPISTYFAVSNGAAITELAHCFTPDAAVFDEGRAHRGHHAIASWQRNPRQKFTCTVKPVSISRTGDRMTVAADVAGNFPGSPVRLDHRFDLAGDRIQSLSIG
jgi:hypothetical protein